MNQRLKSLIIGGCLAVVWTTGCNSHEDKREEEKQAILHRQPFAPLTDSLSRIKDGETAGIYFRRAELLSRNNLHELATEDYRQAWLRRPDELTGLRYSSSLSITGHIGQAIQILLECRKKFPSNPGFATYVGDLYHQSGRMQEALGIYEDLLLSDSNNFEAWYEKGLLLEKAGDTTGAIGSLKKAYGLQPVNTYGLELAHLYAENSNPASLSICDVILFKDSTHELLDPLFIKGIYYSNTNQYKKAIGQFESCIHRDWKFTDAYLEKGIALYKQKNYPEALKTFLLTIKVSDTYPDGYYWTGRCYEATGDKELAVTYYRQALALDKSFVEAAEAIKRLQ